MAIQLQGNGTSTFSNSITSSTGNLTLGDGNLVVADGHGIDFSANGNLSGATNELLGDYEEGTWAPRWQTNNGDWASNNSDATGYYLRVGNLVHCSCRLLGTRTAGTGGLHVEGIPFVTVAAPLQGVLSISPTFSQWGASNAPQGGFLQNGVMLLKKYDSADPRGNADTNIDAAIAVIPGFIGSFTFRLVS